MDNTEKEHLEKLVQKRVEELTIANKALTLVNEELLNLKTHLSDLIDQRTKDLLRTIEQLDAISNNIPDCVIHSIEHNDLTGETRFVYLDRKWETIFGIPKETAMSDFHKALKMLIHQDDYSYAMDKLAEVIKSDQKATVEIRFKTNTKSGWLRILAMPRKEGDCTIVDGIFIDNTYQKELEIKFAAKSKQLEALNSNLPDTALFQLVREVNSGKLHMDYTSSGWEEITGIDPDLLTDNLHPLLSTIQAEDLQNLLEAMTSTAMTINTDYTADVRFKNDVKKGWFTISLRSSKSGDKIIWDGIIRDITDRKTHELELTIHNESLEDLIRLRTVELQLASEDLRSSNDDLHAHKTQLTEIVENKTFELNKSKLDLLSQTRRQTTLINVLQIMQKKDDIDKVINRAIIEMGRYLNLSFVRIFKKDKEQQAVRCQHTWYNPAIFIQKQQYGNKWTNFSQKNLDSLFNKIALVVNNIADLQHDSQHEILPFFEEQELQSFILVPFTYSEHNDSFFLFGECVYKRNWENEDINLTKTFANVTNTILSRHIAEQNLITEKFKAEESTRLKSAFLANMSHEIRTPLNGITGILNALSMDANLPERIQNYIKQINNSSDSLIIMINDILDAAILEAGQMLLCPVETDISQILNNIYEVSTKRMETLEKDSIHLDYIVNQNITDVIIIDPLRLRQILENLLSNAIKFTDKGYIRFGVQMLENKMIQFFVEDTGVGIEECHQDIIFERFRQLEFGNDRHFRGTGLGLHISRRLARLMGGDITVKSELGEGSTFYFTVPIEH
jgi:signal transduction histidine kinase/PAS domain-containing protein